MADDVKAVRPDAPRDVVSQQGPAPSPKARDFSFMTLDQERAELRRLRAAMREIANLVDLPGPMGDESQHVVENVRGLRKSFSRICDNLQTCVQKHRLGLGGEQIDELVVAELDRLRTLLRDSPEVTS